MFQKYFSYYIFAISIKKIETQRPSRDTAEFSAVVDRWEPAHRRAATSIVLGVAFARRRVATAEHTFRLLHSTSHSKHSRATLT